MAKELQSEFDEQPEEKEGLLLMAVMLVLAMVAMIQGVCSRKEKIWHKIVSKKEGVAFILKKAKKHKISIRVWKVSAGDGSKRYDAVFCVHRGKYTWCMYGSRDEWDLTNDEGIANRLWRQFDGFLSERERSEFLS
ncbi:MAG: hypothetical protein UX49_C0005G0007 [Candidatus Wolfebacteria bacterium GW2011_GWC2_46_275]|uniref:Uncharacterized protein n=2 Tax=Candidatus Wolfeibacteriota TaxID=1752735 RepID=A0A0G1X617_9BACT|nr:MAG: hypothetical protein UX70_C0001G0948 [Candidatus Wolfebacteria bacterium GW2011_GWB1_47_1]KKU36930.1 MAG: hypothetical protein UX49_C0005G0007 [Candidatus Wolfebacteria bacterium GW2011_GWC2_46_275]KKU42227.1 MAG: hypothetical protein UX58_C0003G0152 [Candidatus Wolfebacteria bacterium GW2011_GWB2_46_69]KKU53848.1 MAG: hypothetical protein UX76_C0009G0038 [Candidatus Wolfebacteria bacterium GW2011_GWC1_47_103]KKU59425.1 MAG: hypothetical protein UX83_C0005G0044 [Candidatus Wolfebacteria